MLSREDITLRRRKKGEKSGGKTLYLARHEKNCWNCGANIKPSKCGRQSSKSVAKNCFCSERCKREHRRIIGWLYKEGFF